MGAVAAIPPSGLPAISPTRGEITSGATFAFKQSRDHAETLTGMREHASSGSPPLWGRCPAGQRGASLHEKDAGGACQ